MNYFAIKHLLTTVILSAIISLVPHYACQADEQPQQEDAPQRKSRFVEDRNPSAATFDKRLPPVIPGEEISDGKDRMNVWSTSGNVVGAVVPSAPTVNSNTTDAHNRTVKPAIGVIVDQRQPQQ
jgi:hypothetical protein